MNTTRTTRIFSMVLTVAAIAAAVSLPGAQPASAADPTTTTLPAPPIPVKVSAGGKSSCALMSDGTVRCWGRNTEGELGDGTTVTKSTAGTVKNLSGISQLAVGGSYACALSTTGRVFCWGDNSVGQIGDGTGTRRLTPVEVTSPGTIVKGVAVGNGTTCAWTTGDRLFCWGNNFRGQLGLGDTSNRRVPTLVKTPAYPIVAVGTGATTCVQFDGPSGIKDYQCTGANYIGQFGDGTTTSTSTLTPVAETSNSPRVIAVGGAHLCRFYAPDSLIRCTGGNWFGELGNGTTTPSTTMVTAGGTYNTVTAGERSHTCAFDTLRTEYRCWGLNDTGKLGNGTTTNAALPTPVWNLSVAAQAASISAGEFHTCAIGDTANNVRRVYCWGDNASGQLGNGTVGGTKTTPGLVRGV